MSVGYRVSIYARFDVRVALCTVPIHITLLARLPPKPATRMRRYTTLLTTRNCPTGPPLLLLTDDVVCWANMAHEAVIPRETYMLGGAHNSQDHSQTLTYARVMLPVRLATRHSCTSHAHRARAPLCEPRAPRAPHSRGYREL